MPKPSFTATADAIAAAVKTADRTVTLNGLSPQCRGMLIVTALMDRGMKIVPMTDRERAKTIFASPSLLSAVKAQQAK